MVWMFVSPKIHVEALTLNVTVFGKGDSKEVIMVKWGQKDEALTQQDETEENSNPLFLHSDERLYEDKQEGSQLQAWKRALTKNQTLPALDLELSSLQNCEKISLSQRSPTTLAPGASFMEDNFSRDGEGGRYGGSGRNVSNEEWGAGDEASLLTRLPLTSCCVARFLTGRGPLLVRGPGVGDPWFKLSSPWYFFMIA